MAINASSGGQLQGGTNGPGSGGGLTEEDVQDIVASQIEVGTDISIGLQTSYDDATGKLMISLGGGSGGSGGAGSISVKENGTPRGTATVLNFVGPGVDVVDNVATITGGLDSIAVYENTSNRGNFTNINFVSGASVSVDNGTANVTIAQSELGIASASTLGGIKVGSGLAIDSQGVLTATGTSIVSLPWGSITDKPTFFSGSYADLSNKPALFSGSYADLSGKPTIPTDVSDLTDTTNLLGSGGSSYTLPTATTSVLGGVKVDGTTITISNGVITAVGGSSGGITLGDVGTYLSNNGYATQTYVTGQVSNLLNGAPAILDTLNELASAISNDPNFASTITTGLTGKLSLTGGTMTGAIVLPGAPTLDLQAATKKYVDDSIASIPAPTTNLDALTDVDTSGVTAGQLLGWNGTTWTPTSNSGAKGDTGATGPQGPAGLSISSATISLQGKLLITLSNSQVVDAGSVAGISSATVNSSGNLILTKQDGTTINAGSVVGPKGDTGETGATGLKGDTGSTGAAGIGVSSAVVDGSGHLVITKTDSSTIDAGSVIGPQGQQGATGASGATGAKGDRGISVYQAVVDGDGNLQITLDDATQLNAGNVVGPQGAQGVQGPAGRSVADSGVVVDADGNLQITLTDSTVINAGHVVGPQGSTGATGAKGDKGDTGDTGATGATGPQGTSYTINNKSGTVQVYGLGNTTQPGYDLEVDLSNRANKWTTARTLTLSGKVTGLTSFDGSGNITMTTALNAVTSSDITEGTRLYYTDARARLALSSISDSNITSLISYDDTTGQIKYRANTSYITEGSNLYFTNTRADTRADTRIAASSINALADVDTVTSAPTNGQVLTWTGSAWTPATSSGGGTGAVSSVNTKTGVVVLNTDDVSEGSTNQYFTNTRWDNRLAAKTTDNLNEGTSNKYFSNTLARNALAAGTGLSYNSSTGAFSINTSTDNVTEGSTNLYYTSTRFDTRLGQSNLSQLADVTNTTPTSGQALAWNGSAWAPTTISGGGGGGGTSSGVFRAAVQVEYATDGKLASVSVLNGGISAIIADSTLATVTFTFTGSVCAPLNIQVYGYQRSAGSNVYVTRSIGSDYTSRIMAGGGSSGSPSAFSAFDSSVNTMTLSLTKALTGANAGVGQTTHCVVQFLLSSV